MKVRVASYGSNEQDIADLAPVGNTLENRLKDHFKFSSNKLICKHS